MKSTEKIGEGQRILWVDLFKGTLMLMIILSHTGAAGIYRKIYAPVFLSGYFWISGYMTKSGRSFKQFAISMLKGLIIPFFSLGIINSLIAIAVEGDAISDRLQFVISRREIWDDLWFVACLFSAQCIFWIIEKICLLVDKNRTRKYWAVLLAFSLIPAILGLYYVKTINVPLPLQFENACVSSLFITFGFIWRAAENRNTISEPIFCALNFALYIALVLICDNSVSVHGAQYGSFPIYTLSAITGIFALTILCRNAEKNPHMIYITRAMVFIGQNTLVYYAFQSKAIKIFKMIANYLSLPQDVYIFPLVVTILTAGVLAIPAFIMARFFPALVGKKGKIYYRKQK